MSSSKKSTGLIPLYLVALVLSVAAVVYVVSSHKEIAKKADAFWKVPPRTFVVIKSGDILMITRFSKEKDEITTILPDSTLHAGPVLYFASQMVDIIPPGHQNYDGYAHLWPELTMQAVLSKGGRRAAIVMDDGSVIILDDPKIKGGLVKISKSLGTTQLVTADSIAAHAVQIVSEKHHGNAAEIYDKLAGCYTSETKWPTSKY